MAAAPSTHGAVVVGAGSLRFLAARSAIGAVAGGRSCYARYPAGDILGVALAMVATTVIGTLLGTSV